MKALPQLRSFLVYTHTHTHAQAFLRSYPPPTLPLTFLSLSFSLISLSVCMRKKEAYYHLFLSLSAKNAHKSSHKIEGRKREGGGGYSVVYKATIPHSQIFPPICCLCVCVCMCVCLCIGLFFIIKFRRPPK